MVEDRLYSVCSDAVGIIAVLLELWFGTTLGCRVLEASFANDRADVLRALYKSYNPVSTVISSGLSANTSSVKKWMSCRAMEGGHDGHVVVILIAVDARKEVRLTK